MGKGTIHVWSDHVWGSVAHFQGYLGTYDTADTVYNVLFDFGSTILFWLTLIAIVVFLPPPRGPASVHSRMKQAMGLCLGVDVGMGVDVDVGVSPAV